MAELVLVIGDDNFYAYAESHSDTALFKFREAADDVGKRLVEAMRALVHKRTGRLAEEGIGYQLEHTELGNIRVVAGLKSRPEYGIFYYKGTGIHGEYHREIHSRGNVMKFFDHGRPVFTRRIAGQVPHPFIEEATLLIENTYIPVRMAILGEELVR